MSTHIKYSNAAKTTLSDTQSAVETVQRLLYHHKRESYPHILPTPTGQIQITVSMHPLLTGSGRANLVLIQRHQGRNVVIYTEEEFKAIIKESLSHRPMRQAV